MKKRFFKKLKEKLLLEKEFLEKEIKNLEKIPSFGEGKYNDEKEADEAEEYFTYLALKEEMKRRLEKVKKALEKMKKGNFGICEECKKEIEMRKLLADPATKLCRKCALKK